MVVFHLYRHIYMYMYSDNVVPWLIKKVACYMHLIYNIYYTARAYLMWHGLKIQSTLCQHLTTKH